ncbi:hypothetical protein [Maridesulfovibrio frigidus]|uniref:hypothetical protein n=1 Tax=Maridesulfovibrio frigidus TaxID=340956 RepID=UPI0012EC1C30|nr:hypothetical protein [Maridesulfovibrio frigidus]
MLSLFVLLMKEMYVDAEMRRWTHEKSAAVRAVAVVWSGLLLTIGGTGVGQIREMA